MIAKISCWNDSCQAVADLTTPNHLAYCDKYNYQVYHSKEIPNDKHPVWGRVALLRKVMNENSHEWFVLTDIDLLFMNFSISLESFLNGFDLITSYDIHGLNCGVLFVRNCEWSKNFVEKWLTDGSKYYSSFINQEQTSLAYFLYQEPKEHWQVVSQKYFNSFPYHQYDLHYPEGNYEDGDFIIHFPGMDNDKRINLIQEYLLIAEKSSID